MLEAFAFLEKFLEDRDWLAGDNMTIADFCAGATVVSLESIASRIPVGLDDFPRIQAWIDQIVNNIVLVYYTMIDNYLSLYLVKLDVMDDIGNICKIL